MGGKTVANHIAGRDKILDALREELLGPAPVGREIDCTVPIVFADAAESYGPWRQKGSGEEILLRDSPTKRYGVGVLYPMGATAENSGTTMMSSETPTGIDGDEGDSSSESPGDTGDYLGEKGREKIKEIEERSGRMRGNDDSEDFDLSTANSYKPNSMAVSFLVEFPEGAELVVKASGGCYFDKKIDVAGKERKWWLREPVSIAARFDGGRICTTSNEIVPPVEEPVVTGGAGLDLRVEVFTRPYSGAGRCLLTVCLINRTRSSGATDRQSLFQSHFVVSIVTPNSEHRGAHIMPYPTKRGDRPKNGTRYEEQEEESLDLLYRNNETFATGHGCAADWGGMIQGRAAWVSAEPLPVFETPSITSDVRRKDRSLVQVPMATLAGLTPGDNGFEALEEVIELYKRWIKETTNRISSLSERHRVAAQRNVEECLKCAGRMAGGLEYLKENPMALKAFRLANHAILLQQVRSDPAPRRVKFNPKTRRIEFSGPYPEPNLLNPEGNRGRWRAFQIAFLLMAVRSTAEPEVKERDTVELIWFPTGGGKTEAYLGLAAFSMFMRRLKDPADTGVQSLMRYTLRLLTAQQFQRASGLICAMEYLRKKDEAALGREEFSIGIWMGGTTTPNTREQALKTYRQLESGKRYTENLFIFTRCPWCRAQLGPLDAAAKKAKNAPNLVGYEISGDTVVFKCPDSKCDFRGGLPVYVIDEDIYEKRPSLVIGTVDKFAMLAWRPAARPLFGLDRNGERVSSPPGLIIQDELHLISGPLGSMVGLYETVIEELCTDRRGPRPISPKIVSSTATIRRYRDQIKGLYAREEVTLFPPSGIDAGDSFFARHATDDNGATRRGRVYVGVHAPGLGSLQTAQVRTFTSLLQAPVSFSMEERDPWWTLLLFFNSLRELGTTLSLFQSDIPDRLDVIKNRYGLTLPELRKFWNIWELTGRLRSDEVPKAIGALEVKTTGESADPVDVCLASNIIEVGVDIDRLSLMAVVGQPKTTAQYIQVTGRVGRKWEERPGLVVTIYSASKPRDRSHFEKFRSYHERLYAQVEPTSVTPFSPPVLDRALHAVMVTFARQAGNSRLADYPSPYPEDLMERLREIVLARVRAVDAAEEDNFKWVFDARVREWKRWNRRMYETRNWKSEDIPLLREAGGYVPSDRAKLSWATPMSMRNVDAECQIEITELFASAEEEDVDA